MTDESFMTDIDILCEEYEEKIEKSRQEGIQLTLIKSIENVMKSLQCSLEEACRLVGSSLAEYNEAKQLQ